MITIAKAIVARAIKALSYLQIEGNSKIPEIAKLSTIGTNTYQVMYKVILRIQTLMKTILQTKE